MAALIERRAGRKHVVDDDKALPQIGRPPAPYAEGSFYVDQAFLTAEVRLSPRALYALEQWDNSAARSKSGQAPGNDEALVKSPPSFAGRVQRHRHKNRSAQEACQPLAPLRSDLHFGQGVKLPLVLQGMDERTPRTAKEEERPRLCVYGVDLPAVWAVAGQHHDTCERVATALATRWIDDLEPGLRAGRAKRTRWLLQRCSAVEAVPRGKQVPQGLDRVSRKPHAHGAGAFSLRQKMMPASTARAVSASKPSRREAPPAIR